MPSYIKLHWPAKPFVVATERCTMLFWIERDGQYAVGKVLIDGKRYVFAYRRRKGRQLNDRWQTLARWQLRSHRPATITRALGRARRTCERDAATRGETPCQLSTT